MSVDKLGEKVKAAEAVYTKQAFDQGKFICVRLDGKAFHSYTKGCVKPFDKDLSTCMVETTKFLIEQTHALIGYTQSDEISLVYARKNEEQELPYAAKIQKMTSILASMATAKFNREAYYRMPSKDSLAFFDCRAWTVDTSEDVSEVFKWRMKDCIRNAVSMAAHHHLGHSAVQNINTVGKIKLMANKGIDFFGYPAAFKLGTFAWRETKEVPIPEEMKHFASNQGKETVMRSFIQTANIDSEDGLTQLLGEQYAS